jgi:hypothetical protein
MPSLRKILLGSTCILAGIAPANQNVSGQTPRISTPAPPLSRMQEWRLGKPCPSTNPDLGHVKLAAVNRNVWHQISRIINHTPFENGLDEKVRPIMYHHLRPDPPVGAKSDRWSCQSALRYSKIADDASHTVSARGRQKKGVLTSAGHSGVASGSTHVAKAQRTTPQPLPRSLRHFEPLPETSTPWLLQPPPPRFFSSTQPRRSSGTPWVSKKGGVPRRNPQFRRH